MTLYPWIKGLHVLGAAGLFAALGVELALLHSLRAAQRVEQARRTLEGFKLNGKLGPLSLVLVLLPGIYMASTVWGWGHFWIKASLTLLVAVGALGGAVTGRTVLGLERKLKQSEALSPSLRAELRGAALLGSFTARVGMLLTAFLLMVFKP